ncbi:Uncharacterized protein dnm_100150 [Desulfonema magnum]|uniref:Uncharacterized protein n=1 Tax=Desulfonema magnum TaxID=45655 RepID=A0A975BZM1_9BACT|nr:Uncharacterized protein dnm_100150 [Desulfonema magnum]
MTEPPLIKYKTEYVFWVPRKISFFSTESKQEQKIRKGSGWIYE